MAGAAPKKRSFGRRALRLWLSGLAVLPVAGLVLFAELQLWQDEAFAGGWRLQQQAVTGRCRVLDPQGETLDSGFGGGCGPVFGKALAEAAPPEGELVLLLHGLGRTPAMFGKLKAALAAEGRTVVALRYRSLTEDVAAHGRWLNDLLDGHPSAAKVSFVTHSLGAVVLRAALAQEPAWRGKTALGRAVMLAPPNQGAMIARALDRWTPAGLILGPSLADVLGPGSLPAGLPEALPAAVIAGGCCGGRGFNPILPGDDDGIVRVAETRHAGAESLRIVTFHSFIAGNPETIAATRSFLESGRLPQPSEDRSR